jgi:hypothetical protein
MNFLKKLFGGKDEDACANGTCNHDHSAAPEMSETPVEEATAPVVEATEEMESAPEATEAPSEETQM